MGVNAAGRSRRSSIRSIVLARVKSQVANGGVDEMSSLRFGNDVGQGSHDLDENSHLGLWLLDRDAGWSKLSLKTLSILLSRSYTHLHGYSEV